MRRLESSFLSVDRVLVYQQIALGSVVMSLHLQLEEIEKHSGQYEVFGEAEQFMYHVAKVERYELRLECMAYMGNFDDLLSTTQPVRLETEATHSCASSTELCCRFVSDFVHMYLVQQIDAVLSASLSVLRSTRLKKVFEVLQISNKEHLDIFSPLASDYPRFWQLHEQQQERCCPWLQAGVAQQDHGYQVSRQEADTAQLHRPRGGASFPQCTHLP